jgi:rubredoxin---NAD+ reductase
MTHPLVVIGTGLAGYTLAREWRKLDKQTPLVIISSDHAGFYSKPMLSNALASQKNAAALVMKDATKMASELQATVHAHTAVSSIHTTNQSITLADGRIIFYQHLVLALGAEQQRLTLAGNGADKVLCVNNLDDYAEFSAQLEGAKSVLIVGGGLIGCEFANDLLARHITPTVVDPQATPLALLIPASLGELVQRRLKAAGVEFQLNTTVLSIEKTTHGLCATLANGTQVHADVALSATGLKPCTALAHKAGLALERGITVNRLLATSAAGVWALGDCAQVQGMSLPYVLPIMQQARALAATLTGTSTPVAYPAMPVTVKTPACPTVVCPPPHNVHGSWQTKITADAGEAFYRDPDGVLRGFALVGAATSQRQILAAQVPAWLG